MKENPAISAIIPVKRKEWIYVKTALDAGSKAKRTLTKDSNSAYRKLAFSCLSLLFFLLLIIATREAATAQSKDDYIPSSFLHIDGRMHALQNPLLLKDGVTFAPFREVFTALGAEIGYTSKCGRLLVRAEVEGHRFLLERGTTAFYHNDTLLSLPEMPPVIDGTLYFPLRFLLEQAGYRLHMEKSTPANSDAPVKTHIFLYRPSPEPLIEAETIIEDPAAGEENNLAGTRSRPEADFNPAAARVPVLMYHHLLPAGEYNGGHGSIIAVESFAEQMEYLFASGYRTVTLEDFYLFVTGEKKLPPRTVVLTFDDGYASNYHYAYPILKQYHFRAVQFPITGKVNFSIPRMTEEMMAQSTDVFEFHSHSHNLHYYIDDRPSLLAVSPETAREDLLRSRELLECFAFAYPYGAFNDETIELLKETGYKMAFTIRPGYVRPGDDPFRLKRLGVYPETTLEDFTQILENYE